MMVPPVPGRPRSHSAGFGRRDLHVWKADLDASPGRLARFEQTLGPDERARIGRLRAEADRRRATASRGLLRHVLSEYAGIPAAELRFAYGPAGKPELTESADGASLYFNTAHSGDVLLVAVGRASLGVDVERVRPIARWERVARRAFSENEMRQIQALPPELRSEAFITCWTRKEACVKAVGEGVWSAFGRFEVSVTPGQPAKVLSVDGAPALAADWSLYHLELVPHFVGALAIRGTGWQLRVSTLRPAEART
ncbi:MAG: 4'-phosphopantetheinyl transferase superfamily protein [Gemmatimonadetes bacterium]|nr:4'-phosphopantetheinyl transferase superfamily protein [Gemmatimonadota bacterium]